MFILPKKVKQNEMKRKYVDCKRMIFYFVVNSKTISRTPESGTVTRSCDSR
ncbi:MAG: hypothetical protein LBK82_08205 [Planctomycetaceae bacterium]|nr:hypothetical protein [Planctomycetaceae bacterium]